MPDPFNPVFWNAVRTIGPVWAILALAAIAAVLLLFLLIRNLIKCNERAEERNRTLTTEFLNSLGNTVKENATTNGSIRDELKRYGDNVESMVSSLARLCSIHAECRELQERHGVQLARIEEAVIVRRVRRKVKNGSKGPRSRRR